MQCNSSQSILQQNGWGDLWWETVDSLLLRQLEWHCPHLVYVVGHFQGKKKIGLSWCLH